MAIRIVADSAADLPSELAQQWNITVVPCYIISDDVTYRDGVDILPDQFYQQLLTNSRLPTTAQPSAADFQSVYQDLLAQGHQIISIHLSGKLSGTLNSAEQARASLGEEAGESIEIVDSQFASAPLGLVVLAAAQLAQDGSSHHQLAEQVRRNLPLTHCFFLLDTLEYLQRGGRIGKAQAFLGSVLGVKPILTIQDGEVHPLERPRNRERGVRRLVELARAMSPLRQLAVVYSTEPEQAETLRERLADLLPVDEVVISRFGPALGTYVGPRTLGVALTRAVDIQNP
jgi:DegV family protein with EDD domain